MGYAIMRTAKLKGAGSIGGSIAHAYRERETPNADLDRTPDNEVLVQYDPETCRQDIEKGRTRSDNVEVIEVVLTTSPEWMEQATPEQKAEWKEKSMEWLKEEFGEENIQSAVLHKDETTDHISAHVTPIDENGKLNAKKWLGGKQKCQEIQDRYAEKVKDLGLERGERGSKARHQEVSKYYARVEKAVTLEPEREHLRVPKVPEAKGFTGLYNADEVKRHGENCGRAVRDQMREREQSLVAKIVELEKDKVANRGNIIKNTTLEKEIKRLQVMAEKWTRVQKLHTFNPNIGQEIKKGATMEREHEEREWLKKPARERLADVDKRILQEKDPTKMRDLTSKRLAASEDLARERQAKIREQLTKSKSHDRGGMGR
jgi:hypothetical protein